MVFNPNIPTPNQLLSDSQPILLTNNQSLDTSFGIDHYAFSDLTVNNGFHNKVTTPVYVASPPTGLPPVTTTNPILYAFQDTANIGVIQYSRGPSNSVPTPITELQSQSTALTVLASASTNVLDFTGITTICTCSLYFTYLLSVGTIQAREWFVVWDGTNFQLNISAGSSGGGNMIATSTGAILQILNSTSSTATKVFWSLKFHRIQT